ncbi:MAG: helix-hairpin-helix domain-containing protein [Chloroflexi bacterium]|nr:helix-hairpin-helix domain-containing protein [Chloroflexota bacterium]
MTNKEIARIFKRIAGLLELKGENSFKIQAYRKGASAIEQLPVEAAILLKEQKLKDIPGIGDILLKKITEIVETGKLEFYEKLKANFAEPLLLFMDIPGVGPKTAQKLYNELNINTIDELENAITSGRIADMPHIGRKTAENILNNLLNQLFRPVVNRRY